MLLAQQQNCTAQRISLHATLAMLNVFLYLFVIKKKEKNISNDNSLLILHKQQQRNKRKKIKIKDSPINVISFATRLGKDSLCSSFPSLETPKVSEISVSMNRYTFDYADFS